MDRVCPKCGKDYSSDPFWSTSLSRHLARKNPCDRSSDTKYIREFEPTFVKPLNTFETITLPKEFSKLPKKYENIAPQYFRDIFSISENVCFVKPNSSKNEIFVKVSPDVPVKVVKLDEFIKLFVNHIFLKHFSNFTCYYGQYDIWLCNNFIYTDNGIWNGDIPDGSTYTLDNGKKGKNAPDFMISMRRCVKEFLDTQQSKTQLKNILLQL